MVKISEGIREANSRGDTVALWLGASQLHAINQYQDGEHLAVAIASILAEKWTSELRYFQISDGNANFNELLGAYLALRDRGAIPGWLIVAVTYDDFREVGVREAIIPYLPTLTDRLRKEGGPGVGTLYAEVEENSETHILRDKTPQERLETYLVSTIEDGWPEYKERGKMYAYLKVMSKSAISTVVTRLGLSERRPPPIPPEMMQWNQQALDSLIQLAKHDGVRILIYKQPHRPSDDEFYHDRKMYDEYFAQLAARCEREGMVFRDFETIVPQQYWGVTNEGRPDVFHFQSYGHQQLGGAIDRTMREHVNDIQ